MYVHVNIYYFEFKINLQILNPDTTRVGRGSGLNLTIRLNNSLRTIVTINSGRSRVKKHNVAPKLSKERNNIKK